MEALPKPYRLPGDIQCTDHVLSVPLNHDSPDGLQIQLFVREVVRMSKAKSKDAADLPCLLYLQGGPGFGSPGVDSLGSGWRKAALEKYRVLLLDQRGTGRSTPATVQALTCLGSPEKQAEYLSYHRADSIVKDCEIVRQHFNADKLTLLGQSFGGFCILTYLSFFPKSVERCLFTCGLAPVGIQVDDVYRATFKRMESRNRTFYRRYPQDVELVRSIVKKLHEKPAQLPRGGRLTVRRFLQLGIMLGSSKGLETLHQLLELARAPLPPAECIAEGVKLPRFPSQFLFGVEAAQQEFETNPIYWLLHESIYIDGGNGGGGQGCGEASAWSAHRVQATLGNKWDYTTRLEAGTEPVLLTGEMVYPWMAEDYAWLKPLKEAADILASKTDWGPLYSAKTLRETEAACAAVISYDDVYVERAYSEATAALLGEDKVHLWITNEFQHNAVRASGERVFSRLLAISKGEVAY